MTITLIFIAGIMATVIGWLLKQTINTQPWVASAADDAVSGASLDTSTKSIGLVTFLAVATSLFGLFISAYTIRMRLPDWNPLAEPDLLWINTGILLLSSVAYQWTRGAAVNGREKSVQIGLTVAGVLTLIFLVGQLLAWRQLQAAGFYMAANPAYAFFYLLTAVHGLHLIGGLWVWAKSATKAWTGADAASVRVSVELCTVYWHFLLLVWAVLFGLLLSS